MADSAGAAPGPSETTPLLGAATISDAPLAPHEADDAPPPRPRDRAVAIVAGTWVMFVSAALSFCLALASKIIQSASPRGFTFPWTVREFIDPILCLSVLATFFAGYNLISLRRTNKTLPVPLNIVIDIVLLLPLASLISDMGDVRFPCDDWHYPREPRVDLGACWAFARAVAPILWSFLILSLLLCLSALFLVTTRLILLYQRRAANRGWVRWQLPSQFPYGQLTVEFTIKVLRQETGTAAVDIASETRRAATVEAGE